MRMPFSPAIRPFRRISWLTLSLAFLLPQLAPAQDPPDDQEPPLQTALGSFELREIGPAIMGGRVSDLDAVPGNSGIFYVGLATGGLWKTTNRGMTFEPVFEDQSTASIGAVRIAPSNPNLVWVGTGEPQNRQSSPYGEGVFKSVDAGRTWQFMGLAQTRHIARIAIHPRNPDVVYVAAVGHLWGPNEQRGVYKTTDGGATWEKSLYVDENTGAIDLVMDPNDPNTLFAAMYQRRRTPWGFSASGQGSGLYRTLDGGQSWHELTEGLPEGDKGRIGIDVYRRDGNLVYITLESDEDGRGVYRSTDRGETWERMSDRNPRPMYFSLIRIDPNDPERIYLGGVQFSISEDGGRTWLEGDQSDGIHVDHHAFWIDPGNSDFLIQGNDGGVATSEDRGNTWRHHNVMAIGEFYQIGLDMGEPYRVCGGLQDNYSWCGPSQTLSNHGIMNRDWIAIHGGDGFWSVIDPTDPDIVYAESQNGRVGRYHAETGEEASVQPVARPTEEDEDREYRWNWNSPIHISHHDPATVYIGANHLLRSRDRAASWEEASPDLTRVIDRDTVPIMGALVDSTTLSEHDGVSDYGTIVEIGESPVDANLIYVGTDDGVLQVTRDGGETWTDITENVPDLGHGMVVSAIEPSYHVAERVYLTFDGHLSDDYSPHVLVSEDGGDEWRPIIAGLPGNASVNTVREHPETPNLLFLGNEVGLFTSVDRGENWTRLHGTNFPTVSVDDIRIHPRENDLVIGTHGRSIWILDDITPLEQIAREPVLASASHLFPVRRATQWRRKGRYDFWGDAVYQAENPPDGAVIRYWLREDLPPAGEPAVIADDSEDSDAVAGSSDDEGDDEEGDAANEDGNSEPDDDVAEATLEILDETGRLIRTLDGPGEAGIQEVVWDFRIDPPYEPEEGGDGGGGGFGGGPPRGPQVLPGSFAVRLIAAADTMRTDVVVRQDPRIDVQRTVLEERQGALMRLYALAAPVHEASQALSEAEDRIESARELLGESEESAAALLEEADSVIAQIEAVREELDDADPGGQFSSQIENITEVPTTDQLWRIERAEEEVPDAIRRVNELLAGPFDAFEEKVFRPEAKPPVIGAIEIPSR